MAALTVIMTFFNESPDLLKRSVYSILNQTFNDFEFIIIAGNPENSAGINFILNAQKTDSRIIFKVYETKLLMTVCLNIAIKMAKTPLIAIQEADDESLPLRFEKQIEVFNTNSNIDVVGTAIRYVDNFTGKEIVTRYYPQYSFKEFNRFAAIAHPTVMAKKYLYEKYGFYSEEEKHRNSPDFELWVRWKQQGVIFYNIQEVLFLYYQSQDNGRNKNVKKTLKSVINIKEHHLSKLKFTFNDYLFLFAEKTLLLFPASFISKLFYVWGQTQKKSNN
ncbi:MAG: glycosyltransferase [Bacteroidota bacterium]|nr:glycosyltransferase [Bacteroidota bacterium]